ncbi:delta-sarcoglycan-like [Macrosteles quadrilineatus]|uniref:delta-sarcoglycan-like n=1 Tax=Macrosteles quadrilineatus TaxID=74068 RepID=UPI0023E223FB|nr:delta-sarcoglycan-like [Macrosteles quadrilineatus]XP_054257809.1 delta-sarcoglycan-like [Macrosteles quadrilineatus]
MNCNENSDPPLSPHIGIYGWRKRCLYVLILGLLVVVMGSFVATFLLISAIDFNLGGLGDLKISRDGVRLREFSYVLASLAASRLTSKTREPLSFESHYNMTLSVTDQNGHPEQSLHFWSATQDTNRRYLVAEASQFRVSDLRGRTLFTAQPGQVTVGTDNLRVLQGGAHFSGSVQTAMLRSSLGAELMLESATRRLHVMAPAGVSIESRGADISASCLTDLHLSSVDGRIKLKSPGIYIPNLESIPLLQPQPSRYIHLESSPGSKQYQVCMCSNGKLFISKPNGECSVNNDGKQCH